jgi:glycerol-3-phosphate dehydrogenase
VPRDRIRNRGATTMLSPIDGRVMFVLPAGAFAILGTTESEYDGPPGEVRAASADIAYLLKSANAYFPAAHLTPADVVSAWAGIRPLASGAGGALIHRGPTGPTGSTPAGSASREHAITWTAHGLLTVTGGKLTTYRAMAAEVVDTAVRALMRPGGTRRALRRAPTDRHPLPGGDLVSLEQETAEAKVKVDRLGIPGAAEHLAAAHGTNWREVWRRVERDPSLGVPVAPGLPYLAAELVYAVESEMALTLADLLLRRTHVAFETPDHGLTAAGHAAHVVAPLLGWDATRLDAELVRYEEEVERVFAIEG